MWSKERLKFLRDSISEMSDEELQIELSLSDSDLDMSNPENIRICREKLENALANGAGES